MSIYSLDFIKGLSFVVMLAFACELIALLPIIADTGISSLIIAILLGIVISNTYPLPTTWLHGIQFASKRILRLAIILYGFRISIQELLAAGSTALIISILMVSIILLLSYLIGKKIIKLDTELSLLIGIGSAVCGAAAVLALEDILKSQAHKTSVAIATVVIFGTLSMFLYPLLQQSEWLGFSSNQYGIFVGASIHEVAQVVAAANIDNTTSQTAVIVKMMRVILLVPLLFILAWINKRYRVSSEHKKVSIVIPWFAFGFLLMIVLHSLFLNHAALINAINQFDTFLLTISMGAIGLETKWAKIKHVGMKPFYLGAILCVCLFISAYLLVSMSPLT